MAKSIPPLIADYKFAGEPHTTQRIQNKPATANWMVLHSPDVAAHRYQMLEECDFVIIVSGKGVLYLEVKGITAGDRWLMVLCRQPQSRPARAV